MKIAQEKIVIPVTEGTLLNGILKTPEGIGLFPTVVFVPGFGSTLHEWKGSFDEIAGRINEIGILTLQFEFDIFKSDGSQRELPLVIRARQFTDVVSWLLTCSHVDINRIGLVAQSYGAPTVLTADLARIKSIFLSCGVYDIDKSIRRVFKERGVDINLDGDTTLPRSSGEWTTAGKDFWPSLAAFDPVARAAQLTQPVLMAHGDKDTKISTKEAQKFFSVIPSERKKLKIFKGGDHGIIDVPCSMREEFLKEVVEWFKQTL